MPDIASRNPGRRKGALWRVLAAWIVGAALLTGVVGVEEAAAGPNDLLLVTADGLATGRNADLSALFTTFGWTVTTIDDDATPAALTAAAESSGVVYVAAGTNLAVATELSVVRAPVVSEENSGWAELMTPNGSTPSTTGGATGPTYAALDVVDATHPITSPLGLGNVTVLSPSERWATWTGAIGPGMQTLATRTDSAAQLVLFTAESGSEMIAGSAEHRRVFFGLESAAVSSWNTTLEGMVERALDWAAAGSPNSAPSGSPIGSLVMVTGNGGFGLNSDGLKRNLFESFGWTVSALSENATPGEVSAAAAANDVLWMSDSIVNGSEAYDIRDEDIGIVNEFFSGWSGFLDAAAQDQAFTSGTTLNVVDATHPITDPFSVGSLTIQSSAGDINYWDSGVTALPAGVSVLAESPTSTNHDALLVADSGATLFNTYTAPNRRVWFPSDFSDPDVWTADYETLAERALLWAASFVVDQVDTDGDGLWDSEEDANTDADDDPATNPGPDTDGDGNANYNDDDDDDDGDTDERRERRPERRWRPEGCSRQRR